MVPRLALVRVPSLPRRTACRPRSSLGPTGRGRARWSNWWKAALVVFRLLFLAGRQRKGSERLQDPVRAQRRRSVSPSSVPGCPSLTPDGSTTLLPGIRAHDFKRDLASALACEGELVPDGRPTWLCRRACFQALIKAARFID